MKIKVSIAIDKELWDELDTHVSTGVFRNRSHLIEYATKSFLKGRSEK